VWQGLRLAGALRPCDALGYLFKHTADVAVRV